MESNVHCFCVLWLNSAVDDPSAVDLSLCMGIGSYRLPNACKICLSSTALHALMYNAPNLAFAMEDITALMMMSATL